MSVLLELAFFLALVCQVPVESYVSIKVPSGPSSTLESYLCNGSLRSNVSLQLDAGEHWIHPGSFCSVFNVSAIRITGAGIETTIVRCDDKKPRGFGFLSVRNVTIEKVKDMRFEPSTSGLGFIGAGITILEQRSVIVDGCQFKHLEAPIGAASTFVRNRAPIGAAIFAGDFVERNGSATYSLSLVNTVVKDNRCSCGMQDQTKGAAIYTSELSYLSIEGGELREILPGEQFKC
eukprot:Em0001g3328a